MKSHMEKSQTEARSFTLFGKNLKLKLKQTNGLIKDRSMLRDTNVMNICI